MINLLSTIVIFLAIIPLALVVTGIIYSVLPSDEAFDDKDESESEYQASLYELESDDVRYKRECYVNRRNKTLQASKREQTEAKAFYEAQGGVK
jgi:hypothetical protein